MLLQNAEGDAWFAARKQPHRLVNMRTIGESYRIVDRGDNQIGTVSGGQVYGECYKGAIYLHRGRQYEIGDRNPERGQIYAEEVDVAYFTRARTEKDTEILEELRSRPLTGLYGAVGTAQGQLAGGWLRKNPRRRPSCAQQTRIGVAGRAL